MRVKVQLRFKTRVKTQLPHKKNTKILVEARAKKIIIRCRKGLHVIATCEYNLPDSSSNEIQVYNLTVPMFSLVLVQLFSFIFLFSLYQFATLFTHTIIQTGDVVLLEQPAA